MTEFAEFIKDFKAGHLDAALSNKMRELTESCNKYMQQGELTIKIVLTPKHDGEIMTRVKYKMKAPERDTIESIMFLTPENNLVDSDPKQPELFTAPAKTVKDNLSVVKHL